MDQSHIKLLEECFYKAPLGLLTVTDKESLLLAEQILPYSTGIEVECALKGAEGYADNLEVRKIFKDIPYLMEEKGGSREQRFRIPTGAKGMVCLYLIGEMLHSHAYFNPDSGIHYHIDMTNWFNFLNKKIAYENAPWMLEELDTWNYQGTYNARGITTYALDGAIHSDMSPLSGAWIRYQSQFKTAEFRIGEMAFDYKLLIKRIRHLQEIMFKLRTIVMGEQDTMYDIVSREPKPLNSIKVLTFIRENHADGLQKRLLMKKLKELEDKEKEEREKKEQIEITPDEINKIVSSRIRKI